MANRVFVLESVKPSLDLSSTRSFGEIHYIFDDSQRRSSIFDVDDFREDVIAELKRRDYKPDVDAVCLVGSFVPTILMVSAIQKHYGSFRALLFSSIDHRYVKKTL